MATTNACLVTIPDKLAHNASQALDYSLQNLPSRSYTIQTLRKQAIDLSAPRELLQQTATYEAQQDALNKNVTGRLLDVTTMSRRSKKGDEEGDTDLLLLHVSGSRHNELVATILSAPKYTRHRSEAVFTDYNYFFSADASSHHITPGMLRERTRQRDEEAVEEGLGGDEGEENRHEDLLSEHITMHTFPSKICSIQFGPKAIPFGKLHSGPWVCIRTISSTLFATVEVSSKKELLLGFPRLRLVALLEITHGDCVLPSGVTSSRVRGSRHSTEQVKRLQSRFPIVDVCFHLDRPTNALTIDSQGNVGAFDCDMLTIKEESWEKGVSWEVKQETEWEEDEESHWMLEWAEEAGEIIIAGGNTVQSLSIQDGKRQTIYTCLDGVIVSMIRTTHCGPLLWIVTTKKILLFSLHYQASFQALLCWDHNRSHANQLRLSTIANEEGNSCAIVLSNCYDRLLSLYAATVSENQATTEGEPAHTVSALPAGTTYACGPSFVEVADLHLLWHKWIRRTGKVGTNQAAEKNKIMIEMGRDGSIWIKAVSWMSSINMLKKSPILPTVLSKGERLEIREFTRLPEIIAERSLHSLGPVYRALMAGMTDDDWSSDGLVILSSASRWLQEQDIPLETMLLPIDIIAISAYDDTDVAAHNSVTMQNPIIPMAMINTTQVQRLLQQLASSFQSDAWVMGLSQLIEGQVNTKVPGLEYGMEELSQQLTTMYLSQDDASRPSIAMERLANKIRDSCREVEWDLFFSSQVISMRPIVVEEEENEEEEEEAIFEDEERNETRASTTPIAPNKTPSFTFSFFTPRLAPSTIQTAHRKPITTKSARWLLSEWKVGSNPKDYKFTHPYPREEDEHDGFISASDDYYSQSESEQRSSRRASRSVSVSQNEGQSTSQRIQSQQAPPTIGSASQPAFYPMNNHLYSQRPNVEAQSQPIFSSALRAKPKKRRVGGF